MFQKHEARLHQESEGNGDAPVFDGHAVVLALEHRLSEALLW